VLAAYPPADGETFNGVVFVLTVRAPASPREDEHQAAEAVAEVEAAYRAAARRLHSSAAFACIRETPSDGATTDGEASVSVRLERLERGRPPVSMPSLPLIQHYPPGTTTSSTSSSSPSPVNSDVPALRAAKALEGLEDKIAAFVNAQNHAFMTVFDAHNFRSAADSQRLLVMAVVKVLSKPARRQRLAPPLMCSLLLSCSRRASTTRTCRRRRRTPHRRRPTRITLRTRPAPRPRCTRWRRRCSMVPRPSPSCSGTYYNPR
jgi:hypothetical protein